MELSSKEAQNWAMYTHLGGLIGSIVTSATFGGALGAALFWLIKRDQSSFVDAHGREALNFQISMVIWAWLSALLCTILIGFVLLPIVVVVGIVCPILACAAASRGEHYRYPMTIRFF
jgi:uncharacterized protein